MVEVNVADPKDVDLPELPEDMDDEEDIQEPTEEKPIKESTEKERIPTQGDMVNYTKEVDYGVLDEDGNRISCSSIAEAKILSLLFELKNK